METKSRTAPEVALGSGKLVPREALQLTGEEPEGVTLFTSPVRVRKQATEQGSVTKYEAVFDHAPLQGDVFFSFLKTVAPNPRRDFIFGVFDDWMLPERTSRVDNRDFLLRVHEALGEHWIDFEASRRSFVFGLVSGPGDAENFRNWLIQNPEDRQQPLDNKVTLVDENIVRGRYERAALDLSALRKTFGDREFPDPEQTVARFMLEDGTITPRTYRRLGEGTQRKEIRKIYDANRRGYYQRYLSDLSDEQQEQAFTSFLNSRYVELTLEDETVHYVEKSKMHGVDSIQLQLAYANRQKKLLGKFAPFVPSHEVEYSLLDTKDGVKEIVFPHTLQPHTGTSINIGIQPVLRWKTTEMASGKHERDVMTDRDRLDQDNVSQTNGMTVYDSNLAGLLAVAYLSPSIREKWPDKMQPKGGRYAQELGVAQVPVLALMNRRNLMKSPAVSAMEEVAA